jgi:hypothetical protein
VIETELRRSGSPERADMDFLGATLADIRRVTRQAARDRGLDRDGEAPRHRRTAPVSTTPRASARKG